MAVATQTSIHEHLKNLGLGSIDKLVSMVRERFGERGALMMVFDWLYDINASVEVAEKTLLKHGVNADGLLALAGVQRKKRGKILHAEMKETVRKVYWMLDKGLCPSLLKRIPCADDQCVLVHQ